MKTADLIARYRQYRLTCPRPRRPAQPSRLQRGGRNRRHNHDEIARRIQAGATFASIASDLGTCTATVRYVAKLRGLKSSFVRKPPTTTPSRCMPVLFALLDAGVTRRRDLMAATGFSSGSVMTAKKRWRERAHETKAQTI